MRLTVLVSLSLFKTIKPYVWACSSVWLERTPDKGEVGSSSLPRPTNLKNCLIGFFVALTEQAVLNLFQDTITVC